MVRVKAGDRSISGLLVVLPGILGYKFFSSKHNEYKFLLLL